MYQPKNCLWTLKFVLRTSIHMQSLNYPYISSFHFTFSLSEADNLSNGIRVLPL
jgi:hypothetical protein